MIDLGKQYECSHCKHKFLASENDISINKVLTFGAYKPYRYEFSVAEPIPEKFIENIVSRYRSDIKDLYFYLSNNEHSKEKIKPTEIIDRIPHFRLEKIKGFTCPCCNHYIPAY